MMIPKLRTAQGTHTKKAQKARAPRDVRLIGRVRHEVHHMEGIAYRQRNHRQSGILHLDGMYYCAMTQS